MDVETALYVANVAFNTVVIAMDIAVMLIAIKTGEIGRQLFLWMIFLCMGMDIAAYLNTVIHDVPSFAMDTDIFKTKFRSILPRHMWITNLSIIVIGILLTVPMFTPYCGFSYVTGSHVWMYDTSKPYTHVWRGCNFVLQIMDVETALYMTNFSLNTIVVVMDAAIMFVAFQTGEIRRQLVLWMIFLCMSTDITVYLNTVIHDVPSFVMNTDIFKTPEPAYVSVLIILCQWFSQLFALLVLSVLHFIAVFSPAKFRSILPWHMWITNLFIVAIGVLLAVPMFTPYCGYTYVTENHVWMHDTSKPYTYIWRGILRDCSGLRRRTHHLEDSYASNCWDKKKWNRPIFHGCCCSGNGMFPLPNLVLPVECELVCMKDNLNYQRYEKKEAARSLLFGVGSKSAMW
ncbi:unnamed protein product [Haemonchus placei]|uniref:7TM_GPCR_Srx domain-containing protein n=1 Tax=Haemonchus placei TaxID=6290 RepID=A0A158QPD4_HAEPC|nr:unnamed protein product [Haemonchus placei]